jgi:hypothetical protein
MARADVQSDLRRDILAARRRAAKAAASEPHAASVRYDARQRRLLVELTNGALVAVPVSLLERLRDAPDAALARVSVGPAGLGLQWDALNEDVSVAGLLQAAFGTRRLLGIAGAAGGSVRSAAKTRAARMNGRKGGRPRES